MKLLILLIATLWHLLFGAKVKAPLISFGARGQLAKAVVYFPWKGINAVREYVIPANPNTDAQDAQRTHLENAVDEWHGSAFTSADVTAWNRLAGILKAAMSGFNRFVREHINEAILGSTWQRIDDVTTGGVGANAFDVDCHLLAPGADPVCYYGTRKTHFPDSIVLDNVGGAHWAKGLTGLTANTLYYFYIRHGTSGSNWGRTGIYQQRTTA